MDGKIHRHAMAAVLVDDWTLNQLWRAAVRWTEVTAAQRFANNPASVSNRASTVASILRMWSRDEAGHAAN